MSTGAAGWLVVLLLMLAANAPFFSARLLLLGPRRPLRGLGWRLGEMLLLGALAVGLGMLLEQHAGQRQTQGWEFYAVLVCLLLTFGFPGFVWRYLRRGRDRDD